MLTLSVRERVAAQRPYGYRSDPRVPAFPDDKPLIVFDGVCVLCSGLVRFVAARDHAATFRFTAAQSRLGIALFQHYGLDPVNYETNLLIADGRASAKMDAFVAIMSQLGGPLSIAALVGHLPNGLNDWLYDRIAMNRYRLLGRRETCIRPDASWRDRVIE